MLFCEIYCNDGAILQGHVGFPGSVEGIIGKCKPGWRVRKFCLEAGNVSLLNDKARLRNILRTHMPKGLRGSDALL